MADAFRRFEPTWIKVGRVYRRICFLRSEGRGAEARQVEETELAEAAAEARAATASPSEADSLLKSILEEEGERVAEAVAFAEILLPALAERLCALKPAPSPSPAPVPRKSLRGAMPAEARGIADFIDDMLLQERAGSA